MRIVLGLRGELAELYIGKGAREAAVPLLQRMLVSIIARPSPNNDVNTTGALALQSHLLAPATQAVIKTFGVDKFGQPLFVPIAGKKDEDL